MNKEGMPVNQFAMIWNYNAHVEHQHNYYGGKKEEPTDGESHELVTLSFFDQMEFGSEEKQLQLIALLNDMASKIDISNGRSWFCIYAGYRYYKNQRAVKGSYTDFFADIEGLMPDKLTKIDREQQGDKRYGNYTTLLGREVALWYMDEEKLPPLNEITIWKNRFEGDKNRFAKNVSIIIDMCKKLRAL